MFCAGFNTVSVSIARGLMLKIFPLQTILTKSLLLSAEV